MSTSAARGLMSLISITLFPGGTAQVALISSFVIENEFALIAGYFSFSQAIAVDDLVINSADFLLEVY